MQVTPKTDRGMRERYKERERERKKEERRKRKEERVGNEYLCQKNKNLHSSNFRLIFVK
jgi:hypothetical protein